jgi:aryl-alcohol dehydrogenase-like predicted oxidoreductase
METTTISGTTLSVSRLAYGCWRVLGPESAEPGTEREAGARKAIQTAFDAGFTFFDHADIYADGRAETIPV